MLTPEEVLLFKAVQQEQENQRVQQAAGLMGGGIGAAAGVTLGTIPHVVGKGLASLRGKKGFIGKPGARMAGGLVGMMVGGGLGAGIAAMTKQNQAGKLLGNLQAGNVDEDDKELLAKLLGEVYSNPSQLG